MTRQVARQWQELLYLLSQVRKRAMMRGETAGRRETRRKNSEEEERDGWRVEGRREGEEEIASHTKHTGNCYPETKAKHAQQRNALGVLIESYRNSMGILPYMWNGQSNEDLNIPTLEVDKSFGNDLEKWIAKLGANGTRAFGRLLDYVGFLCHVTV